MPSMFFIRPRKGLRIADPQSGQYLPEAGRLMPRSGFWLRRLDDGDVEEVKKTASAKAATAAKEK